MRRNGSLAIGELFIALGMATLFASFIYLGAFAIEKDRHETKQLERIAAAQERQAKSLESIERWIWEPDVADVQLREPAGVCDATSNWIDSVIHRMFNTSLKDNQYIYDYR